MAPPAAPAAPRPQPQAPPASAARKPPLPGRHPAANADLTATLALTALTLASTYGLHRLFSSSSWIGPVLVTATGVHGLLWGCRRLQLRAPLAVAVCGAGVTLLVSWAVFPATTVYGLPLGRSLHAASSGMHQAWLDFKVVIAPTPVTHGFLLATVVAVAAIAVLADWAAFRMRATIEAVVPAFTLFVFICALGTAGGRTTTVVAELAAVLAFIVIHQVGIDRRSSAWFAGRTDGALSSATRVGAAIGVVAVAAALVLSPDLPGYGSGAALPLARHKNAPGARSTISPLVDIRTRLIEHSALEVFTVKAERPEYWRLTSLDAFDGVEWSSNESYAPVRSGRPLANDANDPSTPSGTAVTQEFSIGPLDSLWLPAAYKPLQVANVKGVSFSSRSASLIPETPTADGLSYQVTSVVITPDLNAARLKTAAAVGPSASIDRYLRLPAVPSDVRVLAARLVGGKQTEYDKARALEDFFRRPPFTYSTNVTGGDGNDALEVFLFRTHQGYCQQYAGAYAVLARLAGLPTRVAVGFTPGDVQTDGRYHVRDLHAHAWPEVLFPGVGWVPFEPTPGRGIPDAQQYTGLPPAQATGGVPSASTTTLTPGTLVSPATPGVTRPQQRDTAGGGARGHRSGLPGPLAGLLRWLVALVLAAGVLAVANLAGWRWWRRRRRSLARPGPGQVLVSWSEAADALSLWGVERNPSETLFEFVKRVPLVLTLPHGPEAEVNAGIRGLAVDATEAEFGPPGGDGDSAERSAAAARRVGRALSESASVGQRVRAALDPRFLLASLRRGVPGPDPIPRA